MFSDTNIRFSFSPSFCECFCFWILSSFSIWFTNRQLPPKFNTALCDYVSIGRVKPDTEKQKSSFRISCICWNFTSAIFQLVLLFWLLSLLNHTDCSWQNRSQSCRCLNAAASLIFSWLQAAQSQMNKSKKNVCTGLKFPCPASLIWGHSWWIRASSFTERRAHFVTHKLLILRSYNYVVCCRIYCSCSIIIPCDKRCHKWALLCNLVFNLQHSCSQSYRLSRLLH